MEHADLTERIIGCAMTVQRVLGPGYLESVYQAALTHELRKAGLKVECEKGIAATCDGVNVGLFSADMVVEDTVLVELKAVLTLNAAHEAQLVNYLTATGMEIGLLLNFGAPRLDFRRKHRTYRPRLVGRSPRAYGFARPTESAIARAANDPRTHTPGAHDPLVLSEAT